METTYSSYNSYNELDKAGTATSNSKPSTTSVNKDNTQQNGVMMTGPLLFLMLVLFI